MVHAVLVERKSGGRDEPVTPWPWVVAEGPGSDEAVDPQWALHVGVTNGLVLKERGGGGSLHSP